MLSVYMKKALLINYSLDGAFLLVRTQIMSCIISIVCFNAFKGVILPIF